jgi:anhydro-N-acetylmuramic acid kinase
MAELSERLQPVSLTTSDNLGLGVDWVEAAAFAWLAKQTLEKQPGNSPRSTGAGHPCILGGIYYA